MIGSTLLLWKLTDVLKGGGIMNGYVDPFLSKIYDMVDDPMTSNIVSWRPGCDTSFIVWSPIRLARDLLPLYFGDCSFSDFLDKLNFYVSKARLFD